MESQLIRSLIISLVLTVVLEEAFALVAGKRLTKDLALVLLVNVITNPLVVAVYYICTGYMDVNPWAIQLPLEAGVVLAEGWYYKHYGSCFKKPILFSLGANLFSYGAGILLNLLKI